MSPQAQVRSFPGYGIVYPDGVSGIKVIGTFSQGPSKTVNPDGSVSYSTPAPTIHELFGGGFAYASGESVTKREHLEILPGGMRDRALKWFDGSRELSVVAKEDIPPLNLDEKQRPEPVYVLSSDIPIENAPPERLTEQSPKVDTTTTILAAIASLSDIVRKQGEQIGALQSQPSGVKSKKFSSEKRSEMMKARWAKKREIKNGKNSTEASKDMQEV